MRRCARSCRGLGDQRGADRRHRIPVTPVVTRPVRLRAVLLVGGGLVVALGDHGVRRSAPDDRDRRCGQSGVPGVGVCRCARRLRRCCRVRHVHDLGNHGPILPDPVRDRRRVRRGALVRRSRSPQARLRRNGRRPGRTGADDHRRLDLDQRRHRRHDVCGAVDDDRCSRFAEHTRTRRHEHDLPRDLDRRWRPHARRRDRGARPSSPPQTQHAVRDPRRRQQKAPAMRALPASSGGDGENRTHVHGFAGRCLNHSATSPVEGPRIAAMRVVAVLSGSRRTTPQGGPARHRSTRSPSNRGRWSPVGDRTSARCRVARPRTGSSVARRHAGAAGQARSTSEPTARPTGSDTSRGANGTCAASQIPSTSSRIILGSPLEIT